MEEKLCFVQFLHPGPEHSPGANEIMPWNEGPHKRKFMLAKGKYMVQPEDTAKEEKITFWGEWEAPSKPTPLNPTPEQQKDGYPSYLQEPKLEELPKNFQKLQNTDPYVFGKQFLYMGCQQNTIKGATQLRYLEKGSVVLFGSSKNDEFLLDTVFVVKGYIDHDVSNFEEKLKANVSSVYWDVTVKPWYKGDCGFSGCQKEEKTAGCRGDEKQTWRLYFGATIHDRENDMFSFFPCKPDSEEKGFPRPAIQIQDIINGEITQGKKLNRMYPKDHGRIKELWREVVTQVQDKGLALGVYAEEPSCLTLS